MSVLRCFEMTNCTSAEADCSQLLARVTPKLHKTKCGVQSNPSRCWRKRVTRRCNIPRPNALRLEAGGQTCAYEGPGANTPSDEPKVQPHSMYK